ncbi:MAG: hypothetical protein O6922_05290 [Chloroflexi bacterium]|nr:hypothetical protein [Chloroflexota bacterium]
MKPVKAPFFFERKRMLGIVVGLLAISAMMACGDLQDIDAAIVAGILENVDSVSGEVTVQLKDGTAVTFNLEDVNIEALQAVAGSAVLQPGDEVELTLDEDDSVTTVAPSIAKAEGTILSVDIEASTVTITAENGIEFTVAVTPETHIQGKGPGPSASELSELSPGMVVDVKYNPETLDASRIHFERRDRDRDDEDEDEVKGVISSVDTDAHTITLVDKNGDESTFKVVPSTEIDDDGPATFSAIQLGAEVEIEFDPQSMESLEIEIEETDDEDDDDEDEDDEDDEN